MKIKLLGSSVEDTARRQYVSSYLINGTVAIDSGCLGFYRTPREQEAIRHVFLTHSHIDHTGSLPIFAENAWTPAENCPHIYGSPETLNAIQDHIFNNVMWPDFIALSKTTPPFLKFFPLTEERSVEADGLQVMPVRVNHVVPTCGYVVNDGNTAVIFGADSGPTERLWEIAHQTPGLRAVFLEACFPNYLRSLAEVSLHMTPEMFGCEVVKIPAGVKIVAVHIKVRYREEVIKELRRLQLPDLAIAECETEYEF